MFGNFIIFPKPQKAISLKHSQMVKSIIWGYFDGHGKEKGVGRYLFIIYVHFV
jgi:hypothetical protein